MADIPTKNQISIGGTVSIETKQDQRTGRLIQGTVAEILTSSESHPHGIKVRLHDGSVGRVKKIEISQNLQNPDSGVPAFADLSDKEIPKGEDAHNEFKEFYQYDSIMDRLEVEPQKRGEIVRKKKREVQERFATAVCSFGNKYGGFLYLGVSSDGTVAGLERDKNLERFADYEDEFANHMHDRLLDLIQDNTFILTKLNLAFRQIQDKTICIIQVLPSSRPLYLRGEHGKEFFVRGVAPRAQRLDGIDEAQYIKERFPNLQ